MPNFFLPDFLGLFWIWQLLAATLLHPFQSCSYLPSSSKYFFNKIKILTKLKSKASQENLLAKFQENDFCFCFCFSRNCTLRFTNFKKTMKLLDPPPHTPTIRPALRYRAASCRFFKLTWSSLKFWNLSTF